jgi:hypothetical protein
MSILKLGSEVKLGPACAAGKGGQASRAQPLLPRRLPLQARP